MGCKLNGKPQIGPNLKGYSRGCRKKLLEPLVTFETGASTANRKRICPVQIKEFEDYLGTGTPTNFLFYFHWFTHKITMFVIVVHDSSHYTEMEDIHVSSLTTPQLWDILPASWHKKRYSGNGSEIPTERAVVALPSIHGVNSRTRQKVLPQLLLMKDWLSSSGPGLHPSHSLSAREELH